MFIELRNALSLWRMWGVATIYGMILRQRRTHLGTLWLPASLVLIVAAKGVLFVGILDVPADRMMPNLAIGLLLWRLLSGVIVSSCTAFVQAKANFEAGYVPLFAPILGVLMSEFFVFLHGLIPILIISFFFVVPNLSAVLYLALAVGLIALTMLPVGFLFATACTRYRDLGDFVRSSMRIVYFLTPIIWLPEMAKGPWEWALKLNPFFHLIEIARDPLTNSVIDPENWLVVLAMAVTAWLLSALAYKIYARRIILWL